MRIHTENSSATAGGVSKLVLPVGAAHWDIQSAQPSQPRGLYADRSQVEGEGTGGGQVDDTRDRENSRDSHSS
ncbi:MAG: hypothetical protein IT165_20140 [Bryobacterales bacterium]|nr:hypothetical protein [Bryobacterales bacterium]